jgi:RNA polymerase sigma factor (sigma-70 family)
MELDDAALIRACQQGDADAWDTLVTRYERLIFTIARRSGLDSEEAADVYQHVFTRLVERIDAIDRPAAIASWLIKTTQYEAWRLVRRRRSLGTLVDDTYAATVIDDSPSAQERVMLLEEQHEVRTAVAVLDERCRRLITLLFYQRDLLSYAEVAAILGIPEGSIGPTRARCLQKLRRLLEDI